MLCACHIFHFPRRSPALNFPFALVFRASPSLLPTQPNPPPPHLVDSIRKKLAFPLLSFILDDFKAFKAQQETAAASGSRMYENNTKHTKITVYRRKLWFHYYSVSLENELSSAESELSAVLLVVGLACWPRRGEEMFMLDKNWAPPTSDSSWMICDSSSDERASRENGKKKGRDNHHKSERDQPDKCNHKMKYFCH